MNEFVPVAWDGDGVRYLDQRLLRTKCATNALAPPAEIEGAIRVSRSAARPASASSPRTAWRCFARTIADDARFLDAAAAFARRVRLPLISRGGRPRSCADDPLEEAQTIHKEQVAIDEAIAENGFELIPKNARIVTICNTGPLATAGGGTALGVIIAAQRAPRSPTSSLVRLGRSCRVRG